MVVRLQCDICWADCPEKDVDVERIAARFEAPADGWHEFKHTWDTELESLEETYHACPNCADWFDKAMHEARSKAKQQGLNAASANYRALPRDLQTTKLA